MISFYVERVTERGNDERQAIGTVNQRLHVFFARHVKRMRVHHAPVGRHTDYGFAAHTESSATRPKNRSTPNRTATPSTIEIHGGTP